MTNREKAYADFQKALDELKTAIFEVLQIERITKWLDMLMQTWLLGT